MEAIRGVRTTLIDLLDRIPGKGARFEIHVPAGMWRKKGANQ